MGRESDGELVRRALAGEPRAFAALVGRYRDVTCGVAYHYLGSFDDAQDAAQEAFIHAYRHLGDLRDPDRFAPWLRRTVMNRCADRLRRRGNRLLSLEEVGEAAGGGQAFRPGEELERAATRLLVREALGRLSEKTRLAVTLFFFSGYSHDEIARFLDIPVNTVRSRLQHAKRQLRKEMMAMATDVLNEGKPGEGWTRQVVEEALRRGGEARQRNATGDAVRYYDEALAELARGAGGEEQRCLTLEALRQKAAAGTYAGDGDETAALLRRALAIAEEIGERKAQAEILQSLGSADRREPERATEHYRRALGIYRELGDALGQGECLLSLGMRSLFAGEVGEGRPLIEKALSFFEQSASHDWIGVCSALRDLLAEVGEEWFPDLLLWAAVCDGLDREGNVTRFANQPGFHLTRRDSDAPAALYLGSLFWQISHLRTFLDTGVAVGDRWSGDAFSYSYQPLRVTVSVLSTSERVTVPAGTFEDCLLTEQVTAESDLPDEAPEHARQLNRTILCGRRRAWFAPGVGLVQLHVEGAEGPEALIQLHRYCVAGAARDYLPLAVGNAWDYGWAGVPSEYVAKEAFRVTAHAGDRWFLEHYSYVYKQEESFGRGGP